MPKSRVYGAPINEKPSTATDRPTAKPPSEAYVRAQLNRERRVSADSTPKPTKPAATPKPDDATKDLSIMNAARKLRDRGRQIDKAVEDMS